MIHVQHLLGIGHLRRAATIAAALAAEGCATTLVSGGPPVDVIAPGAAALRQLPPLCAGDGFADLRDERGRPIDDAFRAARRDALLALYRELDPDILITELFPFGRRQMRFELLPLLEAARSAARPPVIAASVRDILQRRSPSRTAEALAWFDRYYDRLLVHADPALVRLEASVPGAAGIGDRIHYTGYVVDGGGAATARAGEAADGAVVVSAGGGAVGSALLAAALAARADTVHRRRPWLLLAGEGLARCRLEALRERAPAGVRVERSRADFAALLRGAALSVSQCGYNTLLEVAAAGTRAVVVPFAGDGETEQTTRARLWAARGALTLLAERDLTPAALAAAIDRAAAGPALDAAGVDCGGAAATARLARAWAARRRPSP